MKKILGGFVSLLFMFSLLTSVHAIENTIRLDHSRIMADIEVDDVDVPPPLIGYLGIQMMWDISSIPQNVLIESANLCLRSVSSQRLTDKDFQVSRILDYSWDESVTDLSHSLIDSQISDLTTTGEYVRVDDRHCFDITKQIEGDYLQNNLVSSFRMWDLDYVGVSIRNILTIETGLNFGATDSDLSNQYASKEHPTQSYRPTLDITYSTIGDGNGNGNGDEEDDSGFLVGVITILVMVGTISVVVYFLFRRRGS